MLTMLFEQYKETKELYKQQQANIEKLTTAVNSVMKTNVSTRVEDDCHSVEHYEPVSSDDDDEFQSDEEPPVKKQKSENSPENISNTKLQKLRGIEA